MPPLSFMEAHDEELDKNFDVKCPCEPTGSNNAFDGEGERYCGCEADLSQHEPS